jgi:hypothetical protein
MPFVKGRPDVMSSSNLRARRHTAATVTRRTRYTQRSDDAE